MMKLHQSTQGSSYFQSNVKHGSTGPVQQGSQVTSFSFPATKDVLWDRTPTGNTTILHITKYRNIGLHVLEKSVQLAYRHALQSEDRPYRCFLIGSVTTDKDEDGVAITVDRFDPGRDIPGRAGRMPTARLPGDQVIPLIVSISMEDSPTTHSMDDFSTVFKLIEHGCSSRDTLDISNLLSFRIHCCCYDNTDSVTFNLHVGAVTMGSVLEATPVNPVPIIPTALARNLKGPLSLSELQGVPKIGYITMDQTRKLLLLLQSDPKACTLPLIGIWVSGLSNLCSPLVWASCLRYMFNNSIHERVCTAEQGFLLVMFSPSRRQPVFYECRSLGSGDKPSFELVGCRENIHTYKHGEQTAGSPVQLELTTARDGPNRAVFMDALKQFRPNSLNPKSAPHPKPNQPPPPRSHSVAMAGEEAQMMPRPSPKPLLDKSPTVKPSVPELSILFDSFIDESQEVIIVPQSQDSLPNPTIPHQQQPQVFSTKQKFQPSVKMQTAQENLSVPSEHGHHVVVGGHMMKSSHVDTPPGRPGPLRPVDANVVQTSVKIRQGSHHHLTEKQIFAKQAPGTGEIINRNVTSVSNRRSQQRPVANPTSTRGTERKSLSNGSTALSKPPRTRKSEISQKTLPPSHIHQAASSTDKSIAPARRMSYPIPVSQKNRKSIGSKHQLPIPSGRTSQSGVVLHSESSQAERQMIQNQHPSSASFSRVSPGRVGQHAAQTGTSYTPLSPPDTPNESEHFTGIHATPEESNTRPTPSSNTFRTPSDPGPRFSSIPRSQSATASHQQKISTVDSLASTTIPFQNQPSSPWDDKSPGNMPYITEDSGSNHSIRPSCPPQKPSNMIVPHDHTTGSPAEITPSGFKQHGKEQSIEHHGVQGQQQEQNSGEMDLGSSKFMVQLRRQEQLIQKLQAQIQMLLEAQAAQTNHQLPAGLMSPPATPTSFNSASQAGATPIPHPHPYPSQATPTNHTVATDISPAVSTPLHTVNQEVTTPMPRPINPHPKKAKPTTHCISTDTACDTSPVKTMCSMAVMTGKSLLWPDGTGSPVITTKNQSTGITPHTSPARDPPLPALQNKTHNLTFDTEITLEINPDMTLPLQQTRDDTQSTVFDVSAVDLHSFAHDISRSNESSPARSPGWVSDNDRDQPQTTNPQRQPQDDPEMTQGSYPMDSLHSPVLGESASTCAPPGRRDLSDSDCSFERSDVNDGRGGSMEDDDETVDQPASLLYRDKKKFYQNLLGNIEQMLTDQSMGLPHHGADEVAMTTQEDIRQLDFNPETLLDRSVMYRSMCMLNSDFFPRINYVSLMDVDLDSPNLSYEANAIAMKYLTEEELIQLSTGFKGQAATPLTKVNPLLRSALTGVADPGMQTGSSGISAVDLSMASRKYMEKYGLLESPEGKKAGQARATGGTAAVETLGAGNVRIERKAVSCARKQLLKTSKQFTKHSVESNAAVIREDGRDLIPDNEQHRVDRHAQSHGERPKEVTPPKVRVGLAEKKEPPQKPPRCFQDAPQRPPQTTAAPTRQNNTQMDTGPGGNTSPTGQHKKPGIKVTDGEKAEGGKTSDRRNILDVQRLKQLPKLF